MSDLTTWFNEVSVASPLAFGMVVLAGLLMGVAPSSLPLVSVVVGTVAAQRDAQGEASGWHAFSFSSGFVLGIATVDAAIGAIFAFIGMLAIRLLAEFLALSNLIIGLGLIVIGLVLLRILRVPWLRLDAQPRVVTSFKSAYALGIPFGLSTCPACTPMLMPVLGAAAASGTPWLGAFLLFTFGLARGLPLVIAGVTTSAVKHMRKLMPLVPRVERIGGALLLLAAAFFLYHSAVYAGFVPPIPLIDS